MLGEELDDGGDGGIEVVEVCAAPAGDVPGMVWDDEGAGFSGEGLKIGDVIEVCEGGLLVVGIEEAVVAERARVPLVADEGDEGAGFVVFGGEGADVGPVVAQDGESVDPFLVFVLGHGGHVMPLGVAGEREEIEMAFGDVVSAFEGALGVADGVVVMDVSPVEFEVPDGLGGGAGLSGVRLGAECKGGAGGSVFEKPAAG